MSTDKTPERSRTFGWDDPLRSAAAARELSGIDFLQAMSRGEIPAPPVMHALAITPGELEMGRVVFGMHPAEYHYNPIGSVHGGVLSTLCDSAMGCAIHTMLPAGAGYTTLELKVNFLRPVTTNTGAIACEGKVIHVGGRVATAEAYLRDNAGRLYAHATTTCMIFRPEQ